ncbi:MAG: methyltransferase domain-containing protein [Candidatus Saccharibacteria bacterium]|nr:methyltransferase domain-containing protein [Candidatus Saccharibacteria bacterium]
MNKIAAKAKIKLGSLRPNKKNAILKKERGILQIEKGQLEAAVRDLTLGFEAPRNFLAHQYIHGKGIEIGAAQLPVKLPPKAKVKYVDVFTAEELRKAWPQDYTKLDIVEVDVVDDGEKLAKFKNKSLDFIIANHFMEHCLDPIGTLINMYGKLRKDGVLFFGIPDKRYTFDSERPITSYAHLLKEHKDSSKSFLWEHTEEYIRLGENYKGDIEKRTQELIDSEYRVHYHVWTAREMKEFFERTIVDFKLDMEVVASVKNMHEVIFILQKTK